MVLDGASARLLQELARPLSVRYAVARGASLGLPRERVGPILDEMHRRGLIRLNGRPFPLPPPACGTPGLRTVVLHLVEGCSPGCADCARAAREAPRAMPPELARAIVRRAVTELGRGGTVVLGGGEPLAAPATVTAAVEGWREAGGGTGCVLHTRGHLLDADTTSLLASAGVKLLLSLDAPLAHLEGIPDDAERILPTVSRADLLSLSAQGLEIVPSAAVHEAADFVGSFEVLARLGFRQMRIQATGRTSARSDDNAEALAQGFLDMVQEADRFSRERACCLAISDVDVMLRNVGTRQRDSACAPCRMGTDLRVVDVAGDTWACEPGHLQRPDALAMGAWNRDEPWAARPLDAVRSLGHRVEEIPRCVRCAFRGVCHGGCLVQAMAAYGEASREDPMCRFYQRVYEELLWMVARDGTLMERLGGTGQQAT